LLTRLRNLIGRDPAQTLAGAQLGLVVGLCGAVLAAALLAPPTAFARLDSHALPLRAAVALTSPPAGLTRAAAPEPEADEAVIRLQDLTPDAARAWNASNPISKLPNPAAKPFHLETEGVLDEARAVDCMTAAVYYEAAFESLDGQRAVAQVVINRLRNPVFPKTVCGVVFQGGDRSTGCQFTFVCDGALARKPDPEVWARARKVAEAALHGYVMKKVGNATHYHAVYVAPYWSPTLIKVAQVGAHIFYRWTGGAGLPPAFAGRYAGGEMKGLQIATLDKLGGGASARVIVTDAAAPAPAAVAERVPEAKAVEAAPAAPAESIVTAEALAAAAKAVTPAQDLDWAGRPKTAAAPRLAMPSRGF
jgi:spore germination cell wall hydrolase CwlJ-like protein